MQASAPAPVPPLVSRPNTFLALTPSGLTILASLDAESIRHLPNRPARDYNYLDPPAETGTVSGNGRPQFPNGQRSDATGLVQLWIMRRLSSVSSARTG